MTLGRYEGDAYVMIEGRTVHGVVQLTSWRGEEICYWGGVLHVTSLRDRSLILFSDHTFLTIGGPEVYVSIGEGEQADGPLEVTGHGEPPFGRTDTGIPWV